VVLPDVASPRSATVAERGSPPVPRTASSAANPVETTRPSASGSGAAVRTDGGAERAIEGTTPTSASSDAGSGAIASAPLTSGATSPQRRGAAAPQRAWSVASAWETSDVRAIGRPIIERTFYSSRVRKAANRGRASLTGAPVPSRNKPPCPGQQILPSLPPRATNEPPAGWQGDPPAGRQAGWHRGVACYTSRPVHPT
jgi:hypothetical protein